MNRKEFESYLIRNGWQDTKYVPPKYKILHDDYLKNGSGDIYEKDSVSFHRLKLLKTSVRLEIRSIGKNKWRKIGLIYYKDLILEPESDRLKLSKF